MADPILTDALFSGWTWPAGQTLSWSFQSAGSLVDDGGYSGGSDRTSGWTASQIAMARDVFAQLAKLTNLTVTEVGNNGDIRLSAVADVPGGWAGYANYPDRQGGSDVTVGTDYLIDTDSTLVHEIGHALGLKHPHEAPRYPGVDSSNDSGEFGHNTGLVTVMSYNLPYWRGSGGIEVEGRQNSFMAADIAALQALYGTNTRTARGDNVYRAQDELSCIWDTGGRDRIDFSNIGRATVIDLRAATLRSEEGGGGWLSHVPEGEFAPGGYTIAQGVVIEDATGGRGRDTITGNAAGNRLTGNGGNDRLTGQGGDDSLLGGAGADRLNGGGGDDRMSGNGGADQFTFTGGSDRIMDFTDNTDRLILTDALSRGYRTVGDLLDDVARDTGRDVVLNFGGGDVVRLVGVRNISVLQNDIDM
jgi:Ca2+-binding RTX toxin-like protein